jgi:4,5-dihydroxyphthalate decarboxylase
MNAPDQAVLAQVQHQGAAKQLGFPLEFAVADYDRTRPLVDGRVKPEGIALNASTRWIGDFCERPVYEMYDVAEFSLSWYVAARCRGEPVIALPVFPLRMPVFAYVLVRSDSPYDHPKDLVGRKIGAPGYRYTVNLWLRGLFKEHYGLSPEQATWITADEEGAGYVVPPGVKVTVMPGATPEQRLLAGEVDAIFVPSLPASFVNGDPRIRRLFKDARCETHSLYRRTGIVPITHTVVMKQALYDREPWLAPSLVHGFMDAQRLADEHYGQDPKNLGFTDSVFFLEEQRASYGERSWTHGLNAANRKIIETFVRYAHEQGYIPRRMELRELFAPNTI